MKKEKILTKNDIKKLKEKNTKKITKRRTKKWN